MMFEDALSLPKPARPGVNISHYQHKAVPTSASTFYTLDVVILSLVLSRMSTSMGIQRISLLLVTWAEVRWFYWGL